LLAASAAIEGGSPLPAILHKVFITNCLVLDFLCKVLITNDYSSKILILKK